MYSFVLIILPSNNRKIKIFVLALYLLCTHNIILTLLIFYWCLFSFLLFVLFLYSGCTPSIFDGQQSIHNTTLFFGWTPHVLGYTSKKKASLTLYVLELYSTCTHSLMVNRAFITLLCILVVLHMCLFFDGQQNLYNTCWPK